MKPVFILCTLYLVLTNIISAQQISIRGKITDDKNESLPGAAISLLNTDSTTIQSAVSDVDGLFVFMTTESGSKILRVTFLGYVDHYQSVSLNQPIINTGQISLKAKPTQLNELNVNDQKIAVQNKGDTVQYNADAFKVNRDATAEDLVTKMPGISNQDGKIQAQGEEVRKVLIDGKPFLGDDPNAAMKNLPAESIDKIQVFDKKSDQAEFTGFDDGNTTKTINIVTRPEFRNGTFGKAFAGYGTEDLWKAGANINSFKDKRKLTFLYNSNNVNEQNFATDDLLGVIGTNASSRERGRGGMSGRSGGGRYGPPSDASNFLVDQRNGIITTYSGGINYVNTWNKLEFSGSYFYNQSETNSKSDLNRQYFTGENYGLVYTENNTGKSNNYNNRANLRVEYKFDSLNSILFQPRVSFQKNKSATGLVGLNSTPEGPQSNLTSAYLNDQDGFNFSAPLLYRHSFSKKGRTISLNLNPSINQTEGNSKLNSLTTYTDTTGSDTLNQYSDYISDGRGLVSELTYTEPAGKNGQISVNYKNNYSYSSADKKTYSSDLLDSSLSNEFESRYITHSPSLTFRYTTEKWNMSAGAGYQVSNLKNEQLFPAESKIDKEFTSILPSLMFQYKFTQKKSFRIFYRSNNNAPSVSQLQNVVNNTNPLQLSTGNPLLEQDWQNFLNFRYFATNSDKNTSFFGVYNISYTQDYIGSSSFIAENDTTINGTFVSEGNQLTLPVNLDEYFSTRFYLNYSFPIKAIKSNLNVNGSGSYSNTPGLINGNYNYSKLTTGGIGFGLSSNISEKIDFTLSSFTTYNNVRNTLETNSNSKYYNFNSKFRAQVMVYKGIVVQSEITYQINTGLSSGYDEGYYLWNASLGYKFPSKQQAELRLSVFDILKQNNSISRNTTDLYYEDVQTNVLDQYFMLTFTYNLKKFVGQK